MSDDYISGLCHGAAVTGTMLLLTAGLRRLAIGPRADAIAEYSAGFHHGVDDAQKWLSNAEAEADDHVAIGRRRADEAATRHSARLAMRVT